MIKKVSSGSFVAAWQMLTDFPLPESLKRSGKNFDSEAFSPFVQMNFPIVGLALGMCAWISGAILSAVLSKIAAALVFAMAMTLLSELKDSFRGAGVLLSFFEQKMARRSFIHALLSLDNDVKKIASSISSVIMLLAMVLKLTAFFIMSYYGYYYWMIAIFTLEFTIQGFMAAAPSLNTGVPILEIPRESYWHIWLIAGFISLFILFQAPYPTLLASGTAFVVAVGFRRFCEWRLNGVSIDIIGLTGYVFELFTLLLGVIFLTGK